MEELEQLKRQILELQVALAAKDEALQFIRNSYVRLIKALDEHDQNDPEENLIEVTTADKALALKPGDAELRKLVAKVEKLVIERCAAECEATRKNLEQNKEIWEEDPVLRPDESWIEDWETSACRGEEFAAALRALPSGQIKLEDLL